MATANKIAYETYLKIQEYPKDVTNVDIARQLGIDRSVVTRYRGQPYGKHFKKPAPAAVPPIVMGDDGNAEINENYKLKKEIEELRKQLKVAIDAAIRDQKLAAFIDKVSAERIEPPGWTVNKEKPKDGKRDKAIITAFLSDLHLDERVFPEQIGYVNEYDREIAEKRLKNFFTNTIRLASDHMAGITYEGIVMPLGGDIFSGIIHEELARTNEATIIQSLIHWPGLIIDGIRELAKCFGKVYVPGVVGNHGRLDRKPVAKNRPQDNFDYLFYHMLARELRDDKRITFSISESADFSYPIYETRYLLTHGDQFKGGGGISGLMAPLMIGDHRKRKRQVAVNKPYDWMVIGHWHQLTLGVKGIIVNGSLKGYDEYAAICNFDYEIPQQAFWLTQPRVGVTGRWPIHVADKTEKYTGVAA